MNAEWIEALEENISQLNRALDISGCDELDDDQMECIRDPNRAIEAIAMVDDLIERCVSRRDARDIGIDPERLYDEIKAAINERDADHIAEYRAARAELGLTLISTGGGFFADYMALDAHGAQILVTDSLDYDPVEQPRGFPVLAGAYDAAGRQMEYCTCEDAAQLRTFIAAAHAALANSVSS